MGGCVMHTLLTSIEMKKALERMSEEIIKEEWGDFAVVGIYTRGVIIAERLKALLEKKIGKLLPFGQIDTSLYRDDLNRAEIEKKVRVPVFNFTVDGSNILLVDDVIHTGRSVRAAMESIIDKGRPNLIKLAVLVDRGGRELPIEPNFVGKRVVALDDEFVRVYLNEVDGRDVVVALKGGTPIQSQPIGDRE